MMLKCPSKIGLSKVSLLFLLLLSSVVMKAQQDTLYYDAKWKSTVKDSASFFRPPIKEKGDLFRIQDYYISGQVQMDGLSKSAKKDVWQGKVTWYNEDGSVFQQGEYENGRLNGEFVSVLEGEKLIAQFKNNAYISGQQNISCGGGMYLHTKTKGDTIVEIMYGEDIKGLRYETYRPKERRLGAYYTKYYDDKGALLGKKIIDTKGYVNGVEVDYYRSPMRVREIRYYDGKGYIFGSTYYYPNGQVREEFKDKPELSKTYYSSKGKELGKIQYELNRGRLKASNGTEYFFHNSWGKTEYGQIQRINRYENGQLTYTEERYENQIVKSKTEYVNGGKELQLNYDEYGTEIARMEYDNYLPLKGIEIVGDRMTTYVDGKAVAEVNYYPKTKNKLSEKTSETETFYDKQGNVLGVLNYDNSNNYPKPFEGKRFTASYEGDISMIEEYKEGFVTRRTSFRKRRISDTESSIHKHIEVFEEKDYNKVKEIMFYSNGSKQSEIDYQKYEKIFGTFYNENAEMLSTYDYKKEDGILYEFFGDADEVRLMEERKEGKQLKIKVYTYGPDRKNANINPVLIKDIDVDCCGKFYSIGGELLAEFTFKDKEPWEGTIYDDAQRTKYTLKQGKRNGLYAKLDYNGNTLETGNYVNDAKEGIFKFYDYLGNLIKEENYAQDKLNGESTYYDTEGKPLSKMIYIEGIPFDGIRTVQNYRGNATGSETYVNGDLISKVSIDNQGKTVTTYISKDLANTIAYYKNSDKKRLEYMVSKNVLNGDVIRYDENGKEQHRATFEDGKLANGIVFLTSDYDQDISFIQLNKEGETLKVTLKDKEDHTIFYAEERVGEDNYKSYIYKMNLYLDYIQPKRLY